MAGLLLGIDGGGSKTRALLADHHGSVLATGVAGTSNYQVVGFDTATEALRAAITDAFRRAGCDPATPIAAACFGLAGVGRTADRELFMRWLRATNIAQHYAVVGDMDLVLAAGTPESQGLALICGTGSICIGAAPGGRSARAGGWGYLLGDEGSGYAIALAALRLATQTADGRAAAQAILQTVLAHWELLEPHELVAYIYRPEVTRAEIAALARPIMALAEAGDGAALRVVNAAADELARLVTTVARQLKLDAPPLALAGGLLRANSLRQAVVDRVRIKLGAIAYVDDPARGAIVLARRLLERSR